MLGMHASTGASNETSASLRAIGVNHSPEWRLSPGFVRKPVSIRERGSVQTLNCLNNPFNCSLNPLSCALAALDCSAATAVL